MSINKVLTSGTNGGISFLFCRVTQSIDRNHGCCWNSSNPSARGLHARRFEGSRSSNWRQDISQKNRIGYQNALTALSACIPGRLHFFSQSSGNFKGSFEMLCVKSLLVFPRKGRRPKMSSYATTPSDHQSML